MENERRDHKSAEGPDSEIRHDERRSWEQPKLAFVEPKLAKHGKLEKVTRMPDSFFGQFS